jgi:hypothetical protein
MLGTPVDATLDANGLFEVVFDPGDVLENARSGMPIAQVDMYLTHLPGMRRHRQAVCQGQIGDLDVFGDSAQPGHVGLNIAHGFGIDEAAEGVHCIELFSESDRDLCRPSQTGVAGYVVVPGRLLEPEEVQVLGRVAEPSAGRKVPSAISVDCDADFRSNPLAKRFQPLDIDSRIIVKLLSRN